MREITDKGIAVKVNGSQVEFYKNGGLVAQTYYFNDKERKGEKIIIRFDYAWGELKDFTGMSLTEGQYQEVINYREETKKTIDKYFNNLEKAELESLSNGSIIFTKNEEQKELEDLNEKHFRDASEKWIKVNRKYFEEKTDWEKNLMGMMEPKTTYTFDKTNIEKIENKIEEYKKTDEYKEKLKKHQKSEERYAELHRLASELSDEDFEDMTGLPRDLFRI